MQVATLRNTVSGFFDGVGGLQAALYSISAVLAGEDVLQKTYTRKV